MDVVNDIISFVEFVIVAFLVSAAVLIVLMIVISKMPAENPLRQLLAALVKPIGIMVAAEVISLPLDVFPPVEMLFDMAALVFVGWNWVKFFGTAREIWPQLMRGLADRAPSGDANLSAAACFAQGQEALGRRAYPEALRWFRMAAERGHAGAQKMYDDVSGQQNEEQQEKQQEQNRSQDNTGGPMTRARALETLELAEGATREQILAAYTRLMKKVHPDLGGSNFFAKQLNEAREILLG